MNDIMNIIISIILIVVIYFVFDGEPNLWDAAISQRDNFINDIMSK